MQDAETLARWSNYYSTVTDRDIEALDQDQDFLIENAMMSKKVDVKALVLPTARE